MEERKAKPSRSTEPPAVAAEAGRRSRAGRGVTGKVDGDAGAGLVGGETRRPATVVGKEVGRRVGGGGLVVWRGVV